MNLISRQINNGLINLSLDNQKLSMLLDNQIIDDRAFIIKYIKTNRIPLKATIEITSQCNLNCYYCMAKDLRVKDDLSLSEIKDVIDILAELGVFYLDITGGEPLLRNDIYEVFEYLAHKDILITLLTNGTLLTPELVAVLSKCKLESIAISLLAPTKEVCDRLTGVTGSFDRIIDTILMLKQKKILVKINVCLTNQNIEMYEEFKKLSIQLGIKFSYSFDVIPSYEGYNDTRAYELNEKHTQCIRRFIPNYIANTNPYDVCGGGRSQFAIDSMGNIMPCLQFRRSIGNILKNEFESIWNSEYLQNILQNDFKRDEKCSECKYISYCQWCPGTNQRYAGHGNLSCNDLCHKAEILYETYNIKGKGEY